LKGGAPNGLNKVREGEGKSGKMSTFLSGKRQGCVQGGDDLEKEERKETQRGKKQGDSVCDEYDLVGTRKNLARFNGI